MVMCFSVSDQLQCQLIHEHGHGLYSFLSGKDRKGGRRCRSLRCPAPQTVMRSTVGLEEPTYSVVGGPRGRQTARTRPSYCAILLPFCSTNARRKVAAKDFALSRSRM